MNATPQTDLVDQQVAQVVRRVLQERMGRYGFEDVRITPGEDHDGDPVLFIEVKYRLVDEPIDTGATFGLVQALREALSEVGETRFPHIRHQFDDKQKVAQRT